MSEEIIPVTAELVQELVPPGLASSKNREIMA
jgi:hypothetical protein